MSMLKRLIEIRTREAEACKVIPGFGICHALRHSDDYDNSVLMKLFQKWPEFSGWDEYPISTTKVKTYESVKQEYDIAQNCWDKETEYGRARWRLVDFLIEELSKCSPASS